MSTTGIFKFSEENLIKSAAQFKHRGDWKKARKAEYNAAWRRRLLEKCCAHMTLKTHPYSGSYIIYAFEFTDRQAYIGLTFMPIARLQQHMQRGKVFDHLKLCPTYTYKILEENISNPQTAAERERYWIALYRRCWTLLNSSKGGGLGTIQITKWTREAVLAEARKYTTRQAWIDGRQFTYRLAKREGWFEEASAHMPRRVLGIGVGRKVSQATRRKQRQAKLGTRQTKQHHKNRSEAVKKWWKSRRIT